MTTYPGESFGPILFGLPEDVESSYMEARKCLTINAFTSCELLWRKILMHIAVDKGAKEGDNFFYYLTYLEESEYISLL